MPYLLALAAAFLVLPAIGFGVVALSLAVVAGIVLLACAVALGATGTLMGWILGTAGGGVSWTAVRSWRRWAERLKGALISVASGRSTPP